MGAYAAEVWPSKPRSTGMDSAYGFGGIGKMIGPIALALIVGSSMLEVRSGARRPVPAALAERPLHDQTWDLRRDERQWARCAETGRSRDRGLTAGVDL